MSGPLPGAPSARITFRSGKKGSDPMRTACLAERKCSRIQRKANRFPRIDSNPLLSTNRSFDPKFLYEPAKRQGGAKGVQNLLSVATDPALIPSMGQRFLTEYTPGQRLVFERNADYWRKDAAARCRQELPPMERVAERHLVRCWLHGARTGGRNAPLDIFLAPW